jgi:hypothetical protein
MVSLIHLRRREKVTDYFLGFSRFLEVFSEIRFTLALSINPLGAPASRRPVGSRKPELAGETPALPGIVPRFRIQSANSFVEISTHKNISLRNS